MKNLFAKPANFITALSLTLILSASNSILTAQEIPEQAAGDLIWNDEFDGKGVPNTAKWERQEYNRRNNPTGPDGWWSNQDSYLDGNGNLVIRVRKIADKNADGDSCDYSVGMVRSKGKFEHLYGKYEIRCKLPTQKGWWVAFWMMQGNVGSVGNGGVDGMEVDIMEGFGWTNLINNAFHWDGYGTDHKSTGKQFRPAGIRDGFHTFAMEWYPESYVFFIDGKETWRSAGGDGRVCNQPGYVKVTGEISTEAWAINNYWAENPSKATYPDSFVVDYVRVYDIGTYQYPVGISDKIEAKKISVYPNPGKEQLTLSWDPAQYSGEPAIAIVNATGQVVKSLEHVQNNKILAIDDLGKGMYFISFRFDDGAPGYLKFLKE
jgi:beta-glucanase (GH16 family)